MVVHSSSEDNIEPVTPTSHFRWLCTEKGVTVLQQGWLAADDKHLIWLDVPIETVSSDEFENRRRK